MFLVFPRQGSLAFLIVVFLALFTQESLVVVVSYYSLESELRLHHDLTQMSQQLT